MNGHVWTGTEWVPAQPMPAQQPAYVKEPMSVQFQRLPTAARIIIAGGLLLFGGWIFYAVVLPFVETLAGL